MRIKGQSYNFQTQSAAYKDRSRKAAKVAAESSNRHNSTNSDFATNNGKFRSDCENVGVTPSRRQASKYRRGIGLAFKGA